MTRWVLAAFLVTGAEADWPGFDGLGKQGRGDGGSAPIAWSAEMNVAWRTPVDGRGHSSPVVADGKVYVISEDGVTTVFAAGPEFKILAENDLADYTLSSPAVSDGQIFLRTTKHLYCIGKRDNAR